MKMKQKSLRQLAKELGVSASYLSQVKNGKRPPSAKVLSIFGQSVKQNGRISRDFSHGEVPELADGHDLGSCAARRGSSSLPFPREKFRFS
jgi:transcriptional regulator with XRE-family HTH domain